MPYNHLSNLRADFCKRISRQIGVLNRIEFEGEVFEVGRLDISILICSFESPPFGSCLVPPTIYSSVSGSSWEFRHSVQVSRRDSTAATLYHHPTPCRLPLPSESMPFPTSSNSFRQGAGQSELWHGVGVREFIVLWIRYVFYGPRFREFTSCHTAAITSRLRSIDLRCYC